MNINIKKEKGIKQEKYIKEEKNIIVDITNDNSIEKIREYINFVHMVLLNDNILNYFSIYSEEINDNKIFNVVSNIEKEYIDQSILGNLYQ